ncbi:MAG: undecaprenyl-diphosphate phosphatase [Flavobacteriales bacterium]|nr:undecaprenyl-diphosphate phosphatase [Flavobacteriales bacterium]
MSLLEVIIIAIVEGLTEFLPISSTGHMIIAEHLLGIEDTPFTRTFIISIQFGAIASVLVLYWRRFLQSVRFYLLLLVAFIPAAILGVLADDYVDAALGSVTIVATSLLIGGFVLLGVDRWLKPSTTQELTYKKALVIGLFQCIAMIPGVSRSAATIIGGMSQQLNRQKAAEFSFFLAVPTLFAAGAYKLWIGIEEVPELFNRENLLKLLVGNIVAFVVALLAIRFFIQFLTRHGFRLFGWYRIILGIVLLVLLWAGVDLAIV